MKKYQVVIQRHFVYEVDAEDEKDAEDVAWNIYKSDDLCDPIVAEVLEIEDEEKIGWEPILIGGFANLE